jgi:predicted O-linked N-acetylglucosamine transferase (SPINDLY family)
LNEHLARYGAADLALDTFPYTSHTTASDALWAGCPLVTRAGDSFASRVAGSLLRAAGRPDLVTFSPADYANLAVALARDPDRLGRIRAELRDGRDACRLFDTPRFVANLENAYRGIWRAFRTGTAR